MSTTAVEALHHHPHPADVEFGAEGVDLTRFLLDANKALKLDIDIAGSIVDGYIERAIDGPSTISATVHDPRRVLLKSKIWDYTLDVDVDGNWFRRVGCNKNGDDLELLFDDRIVCWMRSHRSPLAVSRNKMTRAEFIKHMVDEIKADNKMGHPLRIYSPELHKKQPIAKPKKAKERRANRDGGLHTAVKLEVKGVEANGKQIRNAELILDAGAHQAANRKCMVASIMVAIQENTLTNGAANGTHVGVFQQNNASGSVWRQLGGASGDVTKDANAFFKQCIKADNASPGLTLAQLCERVQVSGQGSLYAAWEKEAKAFVDEYGGGGGGNAGTATRTYFKQYQFTRGQPGGPKGENTWQSGQRLVQEVNWRFFVVGYTVYIVNDDDLLKSKPIMVIDEDSDGIESIDGDLEDEGKANVELTVMCRAARWYAHPGEVITLKDTLGPAKGRWLVTRIRRPFFSDLTTVTIRRPQKPKLEPAPELATSTVQLGGIVTGGSVAGKTVRDRIVKAAQTALAERSKYVYSHLRPAPRSLFGTPPRQFDCSSFAIACYKAAGAPDPSGNGYNGQGYTGDLFSHGTRTGSPKPGDLAFYGAGQGPNGSPRHVTVYIGNGQVISHGHPGSPNQYAALQGDFICFMEYDMAPIPGGAGNYSRSKGNLPG